MNNTRRMNKTLLALAIGAIAHSAVAAESKKEGAVCCQRL